MINSAVGLDVDANVELAGRTVEVPTVYHLGVPLAKATRNIMKGEELLTRYRNAIFSYSWTAIHPINEDSPLYGASRESLQASDATIVVSLTGIDETFSQTVYARYYYEAGDVLWGARFADITTRTPEGEFFLDFTRYDQVERAAAMPPQTSQSA